jgi:hypothetical protein
MMDSRQDPQPRPSSLSQKGDTAMELPVATLRDQGLFASLTGRMLQILPLSFVLDEANVNASSSDAKALQEMSEEVEAELQYLAAAVEPARHRARTLRREVETRYPLMLDAAPLATNVRQGSDQWVQRNGGPYDLGIGALDTLGRLLSPAGAYQAGQQPPLATRRDTEREDLYCGIAASLVFGGVLTLNPFVVGFGLGFGFAVHCR